MILKSLGLSFTGKVLRYIGYRGRLPRQVDEQTIEAALSPHLNLPRAPLRKVHSCRGGIDVMHELASVSLAAFLFSTPSAALCGPAAPLILRLIKVPTLG
jgi:hypothetical protein